MPEKVGDSFNMASPTEIVEDNSEKYYILYFSLHVVLCAVNVKLQLCFFVYRRIK